MNARATPAATAAPAWPDEVHAMLKAAGIRQVAVVPDAGHARLIRLCEKDRAMKVVRLTTEEEGVALLAGAWLGGQKGVLLMQSSGVGFELMESLTPDGEVAKFIEKRGEGVMLVSLNVDDTRAAMAELGGKGYPFIGGARPFRDCEFAFVHPKAVNGVLLELIDYEWRELGGKR